MKGRITFSFVLLISIFAIGSVNAKACSCVMLTSCEAYARAKIVFTGKIVKAFSDDGSRKHQVQVEENFLGMENIPLVDVFTDQSSSCAFEMTEGEDYLIYATRDEKTGVIWTGMCSHTAQVEHAVEDLKYLRSIKNSGKGGGTIKGKVIDAESSKDEPQKPEQINKVYIEKSDGQQFEADIEPDGKYELTGLSEGKYKISVKPPKGFITDSDASPFADDEDLIPDFIDVAGQGCTVRDFEIKINGVINGKVFDANGIPVAQRSVNLFRLIDPNKIKNQEKSVEQIVEPDDEVEQIVEPDDETVPTMTKRIDEPKAEEFEEEYTDYTDEHGAFSFKGLPPGRYLLGFETDYILNIEPKEDQYLPTYFPGSKKRENAVIIELKKAEILTDKNIQLFPKLKKRKITGQVVLKNGQSISKIDSSIYAKREGIADTEWLGDLEIDAKGNFIIEAIEETEYLIQVRYYPNSDKPYEGFSNRCFIVPKKGTLKPVRIVLEKGTANCDEQEFRNQ